MTTKGTSKADTEFENREDPRSVKPEEGDTVEVSYFKTGPEHIVKGEVVCVYAEGRFAIEAEDKVWMVSGKDLRSGTFRDGIDEEEGHISFVGVQKKSINHNGADGEHTTELGADVEDLV